MTSLNDFAISVEKLIRSWRKSTLSRTLNWCPHLEWFCQNFQMNFTTPKTRMMEAIRWWRPRDLNVKR